MIRTSTLALFGFVVAALVWCRPAQGQETSGGLAVDANLAKRGKTFWNSRGCTACHTIGKGKMAGPDLAGVTERRELGWLRRWLKTPEEMYDTDSIAKQLLDEAQGVKMPNMKLSDVEIDALIHYMAQESDKKVKK